MSEGEVLPHAQMMSLATSKFVTKPLWAVAQLGVADLLAAGPKSVSELARDTEAHEPSLYRILRALACVGIFTETAPRTFSLTPLGSTLRTDAPNSMRDVVIFANRPVHDRAWSEILHSVKTGQPGFDRVYQMPVFQYLASDPAFSEVFNRAMTNLAKNDVSAVVASYDFSGIGTIMDVGGGHGALMASILDRHPDVRGIVFDLPHVIEGTRQALQAGPYASRCSAVGGDFFEAVPAADAIIMSHIIHDWDDERCGLILRNVASAIPSTGKVLICEAIVPPGDEFSPVKLLDIEMLVMPGGRERTREEYRELLERAGLTLTRVVSTPSAICVLEAGKN